MGASAHLGWSEGLDIALILDNWDLGTNTLAEFGNNFFRSSQLPQSSVLNFDYILNVPNILIDQMNPRKINTQSVCLRRGSSSVYNHEMSSK